VQAHDSSASNGGTSSGGASSSALSFDHNFLLTAGRDGQLVVHRTRLDGLERHAIEGLEERKKRLTAAKHNLKYKAPTTATSTTAAVAVVAGEEGAAAGTAGGEGGEAGAAAGAAVTSVAMVVADSLVVAPLGGEGELTKPPQGFVEVASTAMQEGAKPPNTRSIDKEAKDITDPKAYSILDAKIKTEEDKRRAAAELQKQKVLSQVKELQKEFEALKAANEALPLEWRLNEEEELLVDPEYAAILEDQGREMVEEVQRECLYDSEKSELRLQKLEERFLDPVATEASFLISFDLTPPSTAAASASPETVTTADDGVGGVGGEAGSPSAAASASANNALVPATATAAAAKKQQQRKKKNVSVVVKSFVVPRMAGPLAELLETTKAKMKTEAWAQQRAEASKEGGSVNGGAGSPSGSAAAGLVSLDGTAENASLEGGGGLISSRNSKGEKLPLDQV
jgi:hypothetical protein